MPPGWIELTRMPERPRSIAATLGRPRRAHLLATYEPRLAIGMSPAADEMLTIAPPPAAFMSGATAFMPSIGPVTLTAATRSNSALGMVSTGPYDSTPALLTSTVTGPNAACAAFGPVTVLVNNAGVLSYGPVDTIAKAEFERVAAVNVTGPMLGMK